MNTHTVSSALVEFLPIRQLFTLRKVDRTFNGAVDEQKQRFDHLNRQAVWSLLYQRYGVSIQDLSLDEIEKKVEENREIEVLKNIHSRLKIPFDKKPFRILRQKDPISFKKKFLN